MKYSILIPAYNEEDYIENCVESVFKTGYKNLEVLIGNDGSTDGTFRKMLGLINKYDRIITLSHNKNKGRAETMNGLLYLASGDVVIKLDADMTIETKSIFTKLNKIFKDEGVGGVAIFGHTKKIKSKQEGIALGEYLVYELVNEIKREMLPVGCLTDLKYPLDIHCFRKGLVNKIPAEVIHDDGYFALEILAQAWKIVEGKGIIIHHHKPPKTPSELKRVRTRGKMGWVQLSKMYGVKFGGYEQRLISKLVSNINKYNKKEAVALMRWAKEYLGVK